MTVPVRRLDIRPLSPTPGDGNHWIKGRCLLYCRLPHIDVMWIGPASTSLGVARLFACGPCIKELTTMADLQIRERDAARRAYRQ